MLRIHPDLLRFGDTAAIQAAEALVKALTVLDWPENRLKPNGKMTQTTLTALQAYSAVPEVRDYLADLALNHYRTNSRQWHYFNVSYFYKINSLIFHTTEGNIRFTFKLRDGFLSW
jgi:hypothetical protein